jgi:nucleoid DNA-binding protein
MNAKEFISELSIRSGLSARDTEKAVEQLSDIISSNISEDRILIINGFGRFFVEKHVEHVEVNAETSAKMLMPPKLSAVYVPSRLLTGMDKEKDTYED